MTAEVRTVDGIPETSIVKEEYVRDDCGLNGLGRTSTYAVENTSSHEARIVFRNGAPDG
jgi:hypothetical protein